MTSIDIFVSGALDNSLSRDEFMGVTIDKVYIDESCELLKRRSIINC